MPNLSFSVTIQQTNTYQYSSTRKKCRNGQNRRMVGCVAQLAEHRSLAGELTLSCAQAAADG